MKQYKDEVEKLKRNSKRPRWLEKAISNALLSETENEGKVKAITDGKELA